MENQDPIKEAITKRILTQRENLASLYITSIELFGSFAKSEQPPSRDIDILVEFEPENNTLDHFMETAFLFEDLPGCKVKVVTLKGLSPHIGPHIVSEVEHVSLTA